MTLFGLFWGLDVEDLWASVRALCYSVHGGSGFSFTRRDVLDMGLGELAAAVEWLDEQRRAEAKALERAGKRR